MNPKHFWLGGMLIAMHNMGKYEVGSERWIINLFGFIIFLCIYIGLELKEDTKKDEELKKDFEKAFKNWKETTKP